MKIFFHHGHPDPLHAREVDLKFKYSSGSLMGWYGMGIVGFVGNGLE